MNSKIHCQALLKVINESYVMPNTSPNKFKNLVNQILASNYSTFINFENDPTGTRH